MSDRFLEACKTYGSFLNDPESIESEEAVEKAVADLRVEWFSLVDAGVAKSQLKVLDSLSVNLRRRLVNLYDVNGNSLLHYALSAGNYQLVMALLRNQVDVNACNRTGYSALMLGAVVQPRSLDKDEQTQRRDALNALFRAPQADVNATYHKTGQTPLMLAAAHGNKNTVSALLAAGADVNIRDNDGGTALMYAAEHGQRDTVRRFLQHGYCETQVRDVFGNTAFSLAMNNGHRDIAVMLYSIKRKPTRRSTGGVLLHNA